MFEFLKNKLGFSLLLILIAYIINQLELNWNQRAPVVTISTGSLRGTVLKSRGGHLFYGYLGIPFAKPPIGDLRFEPPQPPEKWEGIRDASKYATKCVQIDNISRRVEGSEDCLFINVFHKPIAKSNGKVAKLKPILLYIHGGYFQTGLPENHGPQYFLDEDIILVHFSYRVNSLGFLNSGDEFARGNQGLKDQVMAFKWVQENIHHFGGDRNKVTLFSASAGSASLHMHLLSSSSRGLFNQAILQSGTSIKLWSFSLSDPLKQAKRLGGLLNCPTNNSKNLVNCLKKLDAHEIVNVHKETVTPLLEPDFMFLPTIETVPHNDIFLSEHPYEILKRGDFPRIPTIFGVVQGEGLLNSGRILFNNTLKKRIENDWDSISPTFLIYNKTDAETTRKIREFYSLGHSGQINFTKKMDNFTNLISDRLYISPMKETVRLQSQNSTAPIYLYYYNYIGQYSLVDFMHLIRDQPNLIEIFFSYFLDLLKNTIFGTSVHKYGVCHGDELILIYKFPFVNIGTSSKDYAFSRALIKTWVQFAHNHNEMFFNGIRWTPLNLKDKNWKYLEFTNDKDNSKGFNGRMIDEPFSERMTFWENLGLPWIIKPNELIL